MTQIDIENESGYFSLLRETIFFEAGFSYMASRQELTIFWTHGTENRLETDTNIISYFITLENIISNDIFTLLNGFSILLKAIESRPSIMHENELGFLVFIEDNLYDTINNQIAYRDYEAEFLEFLRAWIATCPEYPFISSDEDPIFDSDIE